MALSCSLNTNQYVTFKIVEKALLFWVHVLRGSLVPPGGASPPSLESPCRPAPHLLSGALAQGAGSTWGQRGGRNRAHSHVKMGERAHGGLRTPNPTCLVPSGPSVTVLRALGRWALPPPCEASSRSKSGRKSLDSARRAGDCDTLPAGRVLALPSCCSAGASQGRRCPQSLGGSCWEPA